MSEWIQVGELATGFGGYELKPSDKLTGRRFVAHARDGSSMSLDFTGATHRRVTELRPDIFFIDGLDKANPRHSQTIVLDLPTQAATCVRCILPTEAEMHRSLPERSGAGLELTPVTVTIDHLTVDRPHVEPAPHRETADLIGKRVRYDYGPSDAYEHIYLNQRFFTWHCLAGSEAGLADTDRCHHYRIADSLYLFVWREKIVPTLGVVMIDLERRKSTGKLLGYEGRGVDTVTNLAVGARVTA